MENSPYFVGVCNQRSLLLSEQEQFEGNVTISYETCEDLQESDVLTFIQENFAEFLRKLRYLKPEDQELLLSYYVLGKTQTTLAVIHRSTQTVCSARIRMAIKVLGGTFLAGGEPTAEKLRAIFERNGIEDSLGDVGLATVVSEYASCRNFQQISEVYKLHRPDVRRAMSNASKLLLGSKDPEEIAVGAFVFSLVDKSNAVGYGYSQRKMRKNGHLYLREDSITGSFVVDIEDPAFPSIFYSRANR